MVPSGGSGTYQILPKQGNFSFFFLFCFSPGIIDEWWSHQFNFRFLLARVKRNPPGVRVLNRIFSHPSSSTTGSDCFASELWLFTVETLHFLQSAKLRVLADDDWYAFSRRHRLIRNLIFGGLDLPVAGPCVQSANQQPFCRDICRILSMFDSDFVVVHTTTARPDRSESAVARVLTHWTRWLQASYYPSRFNLVVSYPRSLTPPLSMFIRVPLAVWNMSALPVRQEEVFYCNYCNIYSVVLSCGPSDPGQTDEDYVHHCVC